MLVTIELADLTAFLHTEEILTGTRTWLLIEVKVCHLVGIARQFRQFGRSHTPVDAGGPLQGFLGQHIIVE